MLARLLRLLLLFELFAYLAAGVFLVKIHGWNAGAVIPLMALVALAWRGSMISATYLLAFAHPTQASDEQRIDVRRQLLEGLREVAAFIALSVVCAFDRMFLRTAEIPRPSSDQPPLLLIHGYCCNRGFWWWLKPRLEARGRRVAAITLEPLFGNIDGYAEQVARCVDELCRDTGADQVTLVGHSMGGLVGRAYLRRYGEARVARLVTLGTPHRGSVLARFAPGRNARQMEPGNAWLRELELSPLLVPCIALHATQDNFVMPRAAAMLMGADNRPLPAVGHLAMSIAPLVLAELLEATSG